jgi:hypothetical protein
MLSSEPAVRLSSQCRSAESTVTASESVGRVSGPSQSAKSVGAQSVIQINRPSQSSETLGRGSRLSQPSESSVGVSQPSQSSGFVVRVHHPSRSSESAVQPSQLEQTTSSSLLVQPIIRLVEPRQLKHAMLDRGFGGGSCRGSLVSINTYSTAKGKSEFNILKITMEYQHKRPRTVSIRPQCEC